MVKVILRSGAELELVADSQGSLMEALRSSGADEITALCGGCCSCATCHVILDEPTFAALEAMSADEDDLLDSSSHRVPTSRLACQVRVGALPASACVTIAPEE